MTCVVGMYLMKRTLTLVFLTIVAVITYVATVQVSALVERRAREREQERLKREMDQMRQMASVVATRMEPSVRAVANGGQDQQPTLQSLVAAAHTILLCEHRVRWGTIHCHVTEILRLNPNVSPAVGIGDAILHHQRKVKSDERPAEGMITFLCSPPLNTSDGFAIHGGRIMDLHIGSSESSADTYVRQKFTLAEVVAMIKTANKALQASNAGASPPER